MAYEEDFSPYDMLDGYPAAEAPVSSTAVAPPVVQDFDPRRDISPMAGKLFDDIGADRHLKPQEKFAMQESLLRGISDVSAQRAKLENERRQSMMDNLRIQQTQESITSMRQRQQSAIEQSAARSKFAETVQGVVSSNLDPVSKRTALDKITAENLGFVASDPTVARTVDTARSMIPLPKVSTLTDAQIMDATGSGVPVDVVASGNPYMIGTVKAMLDADRKAASERADDRKAALKEKATILKDLAKDDFGFIPDLERSNYGISSDDDTPYLLPGDHTRGRTLAALVLGANSDEYKAFDALPDAEKIGEMRKLQIRALTQAVETATAEPPSDEDVAADKLFGR